MYWAGIDEAGYGPNLGPLVMTAVVAETDDASRPDLWTGSPPRTCRASGAPEALWIDDSKRLYRGGSGLDRLEAASLAVLGCLGVASPPPIRMASALETLGSGSPDDVEMSPWLDGAAPPLLPAAEYADRISAWLAPRPLDGGPWRIVAARSVVIGPHRFNRTLAEGGRKTHVHAVAFGELIGWLWDRLGAAGSMHVRADKHGGRHFYADLLARYAPFADIRSGVEGPALSRYVLSRGERRLEVDFLPSADAGDGLVALASILSKWLRERWMAVFNAYWIRRVPGLLPTAGYPVDAARFRAQIEPHAMREFLDAARWWRLK